MSYHALISSLPVLRLDEPSYMNMETFARYCECVISPRRKEILESLDTDRSKDEDFEYEKGSLAALYTHWESALRNAVVKIRALRTGRDASQYINVGVLVEADAERAAVAAYNTQNPLDRERVLDEARWNKIEELEQGHLFDFDKVVAYKLKLQIYEKWQGRRADRASETLDRTADGVRAGNDFKIKRETDSI